MASAVENSIVRDPERCRRRALRRGFDGLLPGAYDGRLLAINVATAPAVLLCSEAE